MKWFRFIEVCGLDLLVFLVIVYIIVMLNVFRIGVIFGLIGYIILL